MSIEICYRCDWAAIDCKCPEGPLTIPPDDPEDLGQAIDAAWDRAIDSVKKSPIINDFVDGAKRGLIKWLRGGSE